MSAKTPHEDIPPAEEKSHFKKVARQLALAFIRLFYA